MTSESQSIGQRYLIQWVLATFGGWLLGIVAVLLLSELSDAVHMGNQFAVGLGMGLSVGFAQWRIARKWFSATSEWMWYSAVAMALPFILTDVMAISWPSDERFLLVQAALGASLLGLLEWRILRSRSMRAHWWISTCIIGWMVPTAGIFLTITGHPSSPTAIIFNIGVIAFGGIVLGIVTGAMLAWILQSRTSAA